MTENDVENSKCQSDDDNDDEAALHLLPFRPETNPTQYEMRRGFLLPTFYSHEAMPLPVLVYIYTII